MKGTQWLIAVGILSMTVVQFAQTTRQSDAPMLVEFSQSGDTSVISSSESGDIHRTVLAIRSERGIGECKVHRESENWPKGLILRLHLRGLEQIVVCVGDRNWIGSVSSSEGVVRWSYRTEGAMEQPLDSSDPNWCSIGIARLKEPAAGEEPKSAPTQPLQKQSELSKEIRVPLEDGEYWEMKLPEIWLKENPGSIRISWIDFYR
jgi:hypothetical protein